MPDHPAVGRIVKMHPSDWGPRFVHDVAADVSLGPPAETGFYACVIMKVDYKLRDGVWLRLRTSDGVGDFRKTADFCRGRLVLSCEEDPWVVLPGKPLTAAREKAAKRPLKPQHMSKHDGKTA